MLSSKVTGPDDNDCGGLVFQHNALRGDDCPSTHGPHTVRCHMSCAAPRCGVLWCAVLRCAAHLKL